MGDIVGKPRRHGTGRVLRAAIGYSASGKRLPGFMECCCLDSGRITVSHRSKDGKKARTSDSRYMDRCLYSSRCLAVPLGRVLSAAWSSQIGGCRRVQSCRASVDRVACRRVANVSRLAKPGTSPRISGRCAYAMGSRVLVHRRAFWFGLCVLRWRCKKPQQARALIPIWQPHRMH